MRYVQVTHTYVLPVPADDVDSIDAIANQGVSIMEDFISGRAANIRDLHSSWAMMPTEYQPTSDELTYEPAKGLVKFTDTPHERDRILSKQIIEADADRGVSFTEGVMGQRAAAPAHPWNRGIRVMPPGHELYEAETEALRQEGMLCGAVHDTATATCVGVKDHPGDHIWAPDAQLPDSTLELEQ